MVGLDVPLSQSTSTLSGGQKQRLALAGVLAMQPGLLLLDEPTANLDPDGVREVRASVARVLDETGATLVVIEHRVAVWQDLVDRVVVLAPGGGVLADGRPDEVLSAHGAFLAQQGVWVPGVSPRLPARPADAGGPALVTTEALTIGRPKATPVQSGVGLTVAAGEVLAVTGPNGAGKSTLALTLGGLLPPVGGTVRAEPALAQGAGPAPISWSSKQLLARIGTVFQDPEHQFLTGTVRDELAVGPRTLGMGATDVALRVDTLLARMRLDHLAAANPFTLSGGEKRRLSVATALAARPSLLILDEPTFGQDFSTWQEIVALLAEVAGQGTGVVTVSHDAAFVSALADREYALHRIGQETPVRP
jgi:energy-coupling factor transport system ATP-binding protein